jgi:hypothetical protein
MPKYVKGEAGPGISVIYMDGDGKQWKFDGGARPWRNHNPGNIAFIRKQTGVTGNKKIRDLSATEFEKLWRAIEKMEGWGKEGTISEYFAKGKITAVRRDKQGTIRSYQIEGLGWVSKSEGISLTLAGKVDAVVATSLRGNQFLRSRPNSVTSDNLETIG